MQASNYQVGYNHGLLGHEAWQECCDGTAWARLMMSAHCPCGYLAGWRAGDAARRVA